MKRNILLLSLAAITIGACTKKNPTDDETTKLKREQTLASVGATGANSAIPVDSARAWIKNYQIWLRQNNAEFMTQKLADGTVADLPNSRTVWFGVDQLESMISKIKAEGGDGIRFYFARYHNQPTFINECTGEELNYSGMNTLLMVPTKKVNCSHQDFYSTNGGSHTVQPPIENRGEIWPPPANCDETGATLLDSLEI